MENENESQVKELNRNRMIANPEKFHSFLLSKSLNNNLNELDPISFRENQVQIEEEVDNR